MLHRVWLEPQQLSDLRVAHTRKIVQQGYIPQPHRQAGKGLSQRVVRYGHSVSTDMELHRFFGDLVNSGQSHHFNGCEGRKHGLAFGFVRQFPQRIGALVADDLFTEGIKGLLCIGVKFREFHNHSSIGFRSDVAITNKKCQTRNFPEK